VCFLLERRYNGRSKVSSGALDFPVDGFPKREKKGDLETLKEEKKREDDFEYVYICHKVRSFVRSEVRPADDNKKRGDGEKNEHYNATFGAVTMFALLA